MTSNRIYYYNLNHMRVFLSLLVTWSHCYPLTATGEPISRLLSSETGGAIAVKAFFFISGLLVTESWCRTQNPADFVLARSLRIIPALVAALILTVILAYLSSGIDSSTFFLSSIKYVWQNITLFWGVAYELPGAFASQSSSSVNGSLWTLPWEVRCYLMLLILGMLGLLKFKIIANIVLIVLTIFIFHPAVSIFYDNKEVPLMLASFLAGALIAINVGHEYMSRLALILVSLGVILFLSAQHQIGILLCIYGLVVFFGFTNHISFKKLSSDPSFGIYVYSFPIQQFLIFKLSPINPLFLFCLTLLFVLPLSLVSWALIEKKSLAARKIVLKYLERGFARISISAFVAVLFVAVSSSVFVRIKNEILDNNNQSIAGEDYFWGIYIASEKLISLRKNLDSGYADKQINILQENLEPFIGRWGFDSSVKLGTYKKSDCEFTFYGDISTEKILRITRLPCKSSNSQPILGDWKKEGVLRPGVYFSDLGLVVLEVRDGAYEEFFYGEPNAGLMAISGDWNNDGLYSLAVWNRRLRRVDFINKNESSVADYSLSLDFSPTAPDAIFSIKLPNGNTSIGLYEQRSGLFHILSLESRSIINSIEYGPKNIAAVPIFIN